MHTYYNSNASVGRNIIKLTHYFNAYTSEYVTKNVEMSQKAAMQASDVLAPSDVNVAVSEVDAKANIHAYSKMNVLGLEGDFSWKNEEELCCQMWDVVDDGEAGDEMAAEFYAQAMQKRKRKKPTPASTTLPSPDNDEVGSVASEAAMSAEEPAKKRAKKGRTKPSAPCPPEEGKAQVNDFPT